MARTHSRKQGSRIDRMFAESSLEIALVCCALAIGLIPLLVRVAREFKKHKREEREQLLREYPELAEILHSNRGR